MSDLNDWEAFAAELAFDPSAPRQEEPKLLKVPYEELAMEKLQRQVNLDVAVAMIPSQYGNLDLATTMIPGR